MVRISYGVSFSIKLLKEKEYSRKIVDFKEIKHYMRIYKMER